MYRQAQHALCQPFGLWQPFAVRPREVLVGGLLVQRQRIVDRGADAGRLEASRQLVTIAAFQDDRVSRPSRGGLVRDAWRAHDVAQAIRIAPGDKLAGFKLFGKYCELLHEDCSLHRVEAAVNADPDIVVFIQALAVNAQRIDTVREFIVFGEDCSAIAVATERLRWKEAGRSHLRNLADPEPA